MHSQCEASLGIFYLLSSPVVVFFKHFSFNLSKAFLGTSPHTGLNCIQSLKLIFLCNEFNEFVPCTSKEIT